MDAKITKQRLTRFLSYDWVKLIALAVAFCIVWMLVFSVCSTRLLPYEDFGIINYSGTKAGEKFSSASDFFKNSFSFNTQKIGTTDVTLATGGQLTPNTFMEARLETNDGDVVFVANTTENQTVSDWKNDQGETFTPTYLQQFLTRFFHYAYRFDGDDGVFKLAENYLSLYFADFSDKSSPLNKEKAEEDFRKRISSVNDKRFKSEAQIKAGLTLEYERLEKARTDYLQFRQYLSDGKISVSPTSFYVENYDGTVHAFTGDYAVNICPDGAGTEDKVKEFCFYEITETSGDDTFTYRSAKNLCVVFLSVGGTTDSLFENIAFVNAIVDYALK